MRTLPVDYVLTTYSATMFGDMASVHQMKIENLGLVQGLVGPNTQIVATRPSHENLARKFFGSEIRSTRFADMAPAHDSFKSAILLHYRGAPISDDGLIPEGGTVTFYLIEAEEYQEPED